jgi:hypothetical protein
MNLRIGYIIFAVLLLQLGCAQSRHTPTTAAGSAITPEAVFPVDVEGDVNAPGRLPLSPPLTIDHAIAIAGGVPASDFDWTPRVRVVRRDGQQFSVPRRAWTTFILQPEDRINATKRFY